VAGGVGLLHQTRRPRPEDPDPAGEPGQGRHRRREGRPHPRFVTVKNGSRSLDEASLTRARRLVGLKGYVNNVPASVMPTAEVIASYYELWHVEASFRMSKTDLRARPMFHHTKDAIEAHLTVVFTALAVSREAQHRTGLAIRNLTRQLRPLRSATLAINDSEQTFPPAIPAEKQALINALTRKLTH